MGDLKEKRRVKSDVQRELKNSYKEDGLVLLLGAGASIGSGLPTWNDLVERVMIRVFGVNEGQDKFAKLVGDNYRLDTITGMAELKVIYDFPGRYKEEFSSIIRECLYDGFDYWSKEKPEDGDITLENARSFVEHINNDNRTLKAAYDLAVLWNGNGQKRSYINPNIHAIVNFNLDSLLQAYDKARHIQAEAPQEDDRRLRTIDRPTAGSKPGLISVYHPHGFFRFDSKRDRPDKEAPDLRILTEQEYYDFYNRPMEMYTYTLLHLFREYHCLFVGLSMTDENIRRLLHYSKYEERMSLERERPNYPKNVKPRHFAILKRKQDDVDTLRELSLLELGVSVFWIDDFEEIAAVLNELRGFTSPEN